MSHKTEYIWTCKIGGPAIQFQSGADAPMRKAVQAAFKQVTGNDEVFCFSGWGGELTEPERAVVENRLPSAEYEAGWNRRAVVEAAQPDWLSAPTAEPVAWGMRWRGSGPIIDCITPEEHGRDPGEYTIPLYATPPTAASDATPPATAAGPSDAELPKKEVN